MITGYNTDVRHGDVVFHVQTEDKGESNPWVESLIYVGGRVVASKRANYAELLKGTTDNEFVTSLMERQHRLMIAAIRNGRLDGRLQELGLVQAAAAGAVQAVAVPGTEAPGEERAPMSSSASAPESEASPSLDQVILDYLTNEASQEQLELHLDAGGDLALGARAELKLSATASRSQRPVAGATVTVKMISTVREPMTLAEGSTDGEGRLDLTVEVPALERGTAALIITAASEIGNAEMKHLL